MTDAGRERLAAALHELADDLATERERNWQLRRENRQLRAETERLRDVIEARRSTLEVRLRPCDRERDGAPR